MRRGSAPLELMVAMPLLVWMIAAIMNAGAGGVATADATIAARVDAFRNASQHTTSQSRLFFVAPEIAQSDIVRADASRNRSVPPALGSSQLIGRASLSVFGNVWDRRELPLNDPVHMRLMGQASAASGVGQALGPLGQALDGLQSAADRGRGASDRMQQKGSELNQESPAIKEAREREAAQRRENAQKTADLQRQATAEKAEIAKLDQKIREQEQARDKAREDLKNDPDALAKREAEIAEKIKPLETERTEHKQKLKRIEGEISLLKAGT
ncbi:MAG: hypothetical protein K8U03_02550 [Planctomycetia bacterium]|nr:hypothetical protein [Planctomycetia bacterium]